MTRPAHTDDALALVAFEAAARAEVVLPADAHVIGEPVAVTRIRYSGAARAGLLATCKRGDAMYELSLADVVFPAASPGAALVARYRTWLGLAPFDAPTIEASRPHVGGLRSVSPAGWESRRYLVGALGTDALLDRAASQGRVTSDTGGSRAREIVRVGARSGTTA